MSCLTDLLWKHFFWQYSLAYKLAILMYTSPTVGSLRSMSKYQNINYGGPVDVHNS